MVRRMGGEKCACGGESYGGFCECGGEFMGVYVALCDCLSELSSELSVGAMGFKSFGGKSSCT